MPSTSGAQHRAMEAAAHGRSTLGIPRKVGQDFVQADKGKTMRREKNGPVNENGLKAEPQNEGKFGQNMHGKKFSTKALADAARKRRRPADIEAETAKAGGYTSGAGIGSG